MRNPLTAPLADMIATQEKEITRLRAEVERLTRERDEEIRQKWCAVDDFELRRRQDIFDRDALREALRVARDALRNVLSSDFAEECQECGIGRSQEWKAAKAALAELEKANG